MAIAFRDKTLGVGATGTTRVTSKPAATLTNDLLLLGIYVENIGLTFATPSGWNVAVPQANQTHDAQKGVVFWRIANGTATDSPTVTWGGTSVFNAYAMVAFSGTDLTTPLNNSGTYAFTIQDTPTASALINGITTTVAGCQLVTFLFNDAGQTVVQAAGWTEDADQADSPQVAQRDALASTAGATGSVTHTLTSASYFGAMLALAPPSTGTSTVLTGTAARPFVRIIAYDGLPFATGNPIGGWTAWQNLPGTLSGPFIYPRTTTLQHGTKVSGPWTKTRTGAYVKTVSFQATTRATGFKQATAVGLLGKVERLSIFERPPIRHTMVIDSPIGLVQRWAFDAPNVQDVLTDATWGSTMPGGWDRMDCSLFRRPELRSSDIEPFSRATVYNAGGKVVGQFRVEQTPATHGDSSQVQPGAVGYQSELDDNKAAAFDYVNADSSSWSGPILARQIQLVSTFGRDIETLSWQVVKGSLSITLPNGPVPASAYAEVWFRMPPGTGVGRFEYSGSDNMPVGYELPTLYFNNDDTGAIAGSGQQLNLTSTPSFVSFPTGTRRFLVLVLYANGIAATGNKNQRVISPRVLGFTGLPPRPGPDGFSGVFGSDAVQHAISTWTDFTFTTGPTGTIVPSTFVIPHLGFRDLGAVSDIVRGATRFGLEDWAVWESDQRTGQPVFWWHPRRYYGTTWRARVGPSKLNLTGTQVARVWNSVVVQYTDALTGETRSVGPPGSGADASDPVLNDADPQNPATVAGKTRRALLQMQTTTLAGATKVGQIFLSEQKLLDSSGDAEFVGWIQNEQGVWHAASDVRAGDYVEFVDSNHPGSRRIIKTSWSEANKSMHVDLDSPPDAMEALLERLQVVLVPLGDG